MLGRHQQFHLAHKEAALLIVQVGIQEGVVGVATVHAVGQHISGGQCFHLHIPAKPVQHGQIPPAHGQMNVAAETGAGLVGNVDGERPVFQKQAHGHGGVELPGGVVQCFVAPEAVHAGPGGHRPAVVELPVGRAHAVPPLTAEVFHAVFDGVRLQQLGRVHQILKGGRIQVIVRQIPQDLPVAAPALLMVLHDAGEAVQVFLPGECADGLHGGEALEAILGAEAEAFLPVGGEGDAAVPDLPVVGVALGGVVRVVKTAAGGGTGRPVVGVRRISLAQLRQQMAVQAGVIVPHQLVVPGTPVDDTAFHLVVAAQQGEGGVMVQPLQVADGFLRELLGHLRRQIDVGAGDHEVLPHQQAVLIAQLVEAAVGVVPAAPDPQGVEVGVHSLTDDGFPPLVGDAAEQIVHGNQIRAHGENFHAVQHKAEFAALAVRVRLRADGEGAQAELLVAAVDDLAAANQLHIQIIKGLVAVASCPPQLRVIHLDNAVAVFQENALAVEVCVDFAPGVTFGGHVQLHRDAAVFVVLADGHAVETVHVPALQLHAPENAHVRQGGTPVPAGLVHGLAQMGGAGEGVAVVHVQVVLVLLLGEVAPGGLEFQPEGVFPGCQQGLDLVDVLPVHIFDLAQQGAVQVNMADGVKPMKYQLDMFPREQSGRGGKDGFKDAVLFGQILQLPLICAVEGVGDFSVVIEHAVHGAGRLTGQRPEVVIVQCPILNVHEGSSRFGICCYYGAKRRRFQVPIFRGGHRGRKKV